LKKTTAVVETLLKIVTKYCVCVRISLFRVSRCQWCYCPYLLCRDGVVKIWLYGAKTDTAADEAVPHCGLTLNVRDFDNTIVCCLVVVMIWWLELIVAHATYLHC